MKMMCRGGAVLLQVPSGCRGGTQGWPPTSGAAGTLKLLDAHSQSSPGCGSLTGPHITPLPAQREAQLLHPLTEQPSMGVMAWTLQSIKAQSLSGQLCCSVFKPTQKEHLPVYPASHPLLQLTSILLFSGFLLIGRRNCHCPRASSNPLGQLPGIAGLL